MTCVGGGDTSIQSRKQGPFTVCLAEFLGKGQGKGQIARDALFELFGRRRKRYVHNIESPSTGSSKGPNLKNGRGDWIRTNDPLLPKQVRYQTALRPDCGCGGCRCVGQVPRKCSRCRRLGWPAGICRIDLLSLADSFGLRGAARRRSVDCGGASTAAILMDMVSLIQRACCCRMLSVRRCPR